MKRPRLSLHCSCDASATGIASPVSAAIRLRDLWLSVHSGDGHIVTDRSVGLDLSTPPPAVTEQAAGVPTPRVDNREALIG